MFIDSHQHFWRYSAAEYGWIDAPMAAIRRDFLPDNLRVEIQAAGVDGVVSVQARQSLEETRWLLELVRGADFIRAVVGWVPLIADDLRALLDTLAADPKLRGVRHVLQGEADEYMARDDFNRGVSLLRHFGLAYDLLIFGRQLPAATKFVDKHPGQVFILDHIAKPKIKLNELQPWAKQMKELARRPNVFCKISGMVTEADYHNWSESQLRPFFDVALAAFGPGRLMAGSDWPVCLVACPYRKWIDILRRWAATLSESEQCSFFSGSAITAYGLK